MEDVFELDIIKERVNPNRINLSLIKEAYGDKYPEEEILIRATDMDDEEYNLLEDKAFLQGLSNLERGLPDTAGDLQDFHTRYGNIASRISQRVAPRSGSGLAKLFRRGR